MRRKFKNTFNIDFLPNRKYVAEIYRNDWKEIISNKILIIIVIGLTLIPSLYAWFNIEAFWDPYGNTKNLKVAIVNKDKGENFRDQNFQLGNRIVDNLKENENLKWEFVAEKYAEKKLKSGEYYAIITIPPDFTKNLLSLTQENVKKAEIDYKINEKTNAIAPKITDQGANKIKENISKMLVETVSKASITALGGVSTGIEKINPELDKMKETLTQLKKEIDNADKLNSSNGELIKNGNKSIANSKKTLENISKLNQQAKDINNSINSSINSAANNAKSNSGQLKIMLNNASDGLNSANNVLSNIGDINTDSNTQLQDAISNMQTSISTSRTNIEQIIAVLQNASVDSTALNQPISRLKEIDNKLIEYSKKLDKASNTLANDGKLNSNLINDLSAMNQDVINLTSNISNSYDSMIKQPLDSLSTTAKTANTNVGSLVDSVNNINPNIENMLDNAQNINNTMASTLKINSNILANIKLQIDNSISLIYRIQNNQDLKQFNKVIKSNIYDRVDFLKNPVNVKETKLYPIKNYGSAMAPFYSVLSCWVGALILCAVLNTKARGHVYSPIDKYFGRLSLFLTLAVGQALIIGIGDIVLLGVTAKHVMLFIFTLVFCSIVFCLLIFSLAILFGTIGKGIAVFLLVIQIGGSGGTFPVQMTPTFFRTINKFIPFTYGINACREAIGGVYMPNLIKDYIALIIFAIIPVIFSMIFKGKLMKINSPITNKLMNSFLIH
ncbi:YhgE/Pip domain-containing protein [Peptostreptococcus equinus]|uniref:YhgE/Pip domain-containing protein n=1 Tax=Peptostreptococcus equinus TaxID=3003601 RepID=A0ABY7JQN0_9FIRM|nr:YhgE/Pip domain-containing protein [Peptostreptococcus sp. CBA3647]WAW13987.1 YhgE/Pip domain-containing protein [Peptostreptococcus sp. CBA3647]